MSGNYSGIFTLLYTATIRVFPFLLRAYRNSPYQFTKRFNPQALIVADEGGIQVGHFLFIPPKIYYPT